MLMSTKIYDAYKFDKNYSIKELMDKLSSLKPAIKEVFYKDIKNQIMDCFLEYYDAVKYLTPEEYDKLTSRVTNQTTLNNYRLAEQGKWDVLLMNIQMQKINEFKKNNDLTTAEIVIIPTENDLLCMLFGDTEIMNIITSNLPLSDYHYQNQFDKPDDISDEEWLKRESDWYDAIGPDYVPSNHGFIYNFFDSYNLVPFSKNQLIKDYLQDDLTRINSIIDKLDDYPNPPSKTANYSEWSRYMRTDTYKKWLKDKMDYYKSIIKPFNFE